MGSFSNGVYVPAIGEVGWGTNVNDFLTRSGQQAVNVMQAPYAAVGDGSHDDSSAIQAAIDAGSVILFPPGFTFSHATTLLPHNGSVWIFGGMRRYDASTGGSALKYTGSGKAVDCTGVDNFEIRDGKVEVTNTAAVAVYLNNCNFIDLTRVTLKGPGTGGTSYGIKAEGQATCQCHGTYKSVQVNGFATGVSLSGFSNANEFINCIASTCATGISIAKTGSDTIGGRDNLFERVELDSGVTTGVVLADTAINNLFLKTVEDGSFTTGLSITSNCTNNAFIICILQGAISDSSTTTLYVGVAGAGAVGQAGLAFGDSNLYRNGNNQLKTDDDFAIAGQGKVGAYVGGLASSTGLGVFGNSEFSNNLAIGADLDHNGTKVGFYGTAPIVKQTGVAITAAGIHAALTNLGLIAP